MGALLITDNTGLRTVPLSSSTLVGRHFHCGCQIYDPAIHLYWLEIRWVGAMWMWRVLSGANRTRGAGAMVHDDWRELKWANGRGGRIVWDELCVVELIDPSPPQLIGRDLRSRRWLDDEELQKWIETVPGGFRTTATTDDELLRDGDIVQTPNGIIQIYLPYPPKETETSIFSMSHDKLRVDIDIENLYASFTVGKKEVSIRGECVRVLAVYAKARRDHGPESGWVSRRHAHQHWIELGGKPDSPEARIAWERGKIRTQLSRQHVSAVHALFDIQDRNGQRVSRLAIRPDHISLID